MKQIDQQTILRTMIELAHDAILLLDPHGLIIQANAAALYICGFKSIDDIRPTIKFTDLFYLYDFNHIEVPLEQHPVSRALNG
ncbi:MAG TPA: PAS domain-containing protein, partial [Chitinispirillaceae bacterium]|nr:PAS domain-containing protein [Chitinispirillaceae bacterium]